MWGDVFSVHENGETQDVYVSQQDKELDRFLYDSDNDYVGTSCDALYSMYIDGKFSNGELSIEKTIGTKKGNEFSQAEKVIVLTPKKAVQLVIFLVSLSYLIWVFALK